MASSLEQIADEIVKTDFLIIGGGLAGLVAAIRARKGNIDVAIMERATIKFGGNAIGVDDHVIEYPGIIEHPLPKDFTSEDAAKGEFGAKRLHNIVNPKLAVTEAKNYVKPLVLLEEIGVQIREDDGTVKVKQTQRMPGGPTWNRLVPDDDGNLTGDKVFYRGADLKEKLAIAAERSGARVFNHTILTGLITKDGSAVGAMGMNIRSGKFIVFKAKIILLSTGGIQRMYPYADAPFPSNLFLNTHFVGNHGGGAAAAFRAGAKLTNLEFLQVYTVAAGACATSAAGGGMYWTVQNSKGETLEEKYQERMLKKMGGYFPATNFVYAPDMQAPEIERDVITYDTSNATDDEIHACYFTCATEYPRMLKLHKIAGGIRRDGPIEVKIFIPGLTSGVSGILPANDRGETSIKNLFVAGIVSSGLGNDGSRAVVWGHIVGDHVRKLVHEIKPPIFKSEQFLQVETEKSRVFAPMGVGGDHPLELEHYIRMVNMNYVNVKKIAPRLKHSVNIMKMVREKAIPTLGAKTFHELVHCLEVQDILELSEIHAQSSLMRTESRMAPGHYRIDYPEQDDSRWGNIIITAQNIFGETKYSLEKIE